MDFGAGTISLNHLFKRDCVQCPNEAPSCPSCPSGEVCSMSTVTCDNCPSTSCVKSAIASTSSASSKSSSSGSSLNAGAIAGGVIGGVAVVAIVTYLVWRFCIKAKRGEYEQEQEQWQVEEDHRQAEKDFTLRRDARASTHTVGSIASTVLTRASNIIQIAYIPGVTNRSTPASPDVLVPPVPPIPIALSSAASTPGYEEQHFFMPGDLRDSTYSAVTDRTSYATRNSVASTIYGRNAVVSPVPAQTVIRGKAAVVSVKSGANGSGETTPPMPSLDFEKYRSRGPPSPAFSVGSTFLNSASAATQVKPQVVRVVNSTRSKSSLQKSDSASDTTGNYRESSLLDSSSITIIDDTPRLAQSPFSDPPTPVRGHKKNGSLSAVIDDANKKARDQPKREGTPFGDEHETHDD